MFKNKSKDGSNNISGMRISKLRKKLNLSQKGLADKLQLIGLNVGKNTIQKIESGEGFVTDIELQYLSKFFKVPIRDLVDSELLDDQYTSLSQKVAEDDE